MKQPCTVFVVDDDQLIRIALRRLIESVGLNVETYDSPEAFLDGYDRSRPGCLVLDVRLPGQSGLDLQKRLLDRKDLVPIVFITGHGDVPMSVRAIKAGAVDFLQKPFDDQTLLDAIHEALKRDQQRRAESAQRQSINSRISRLSPRERQVLDGIVAGKLNKQIAGELQIAEQTVKVHRARVMEKMQAESIAELAVLMHRYQAELNTS